MDIRPAAVRLSVCYVNRDGQTDRRPCEVNGGSCCQEETECAVGVAGAPGGRIVNGTQAAPGQFPFQVSPCFMPRQSTGAQLPSLSVLSVSSGGIHPRILSLGIGWR
jgi:hypothetical protein